MLDGEIVAFDDQNMPSFNSPQHRAGDATTLIYFVFDVLAFRGRDVRRLTLARRLELLDDVMGSARHPVRRAPVLNAGPKALIAAVKANGLEGIVAKRIESRYESRLRSGAWVKFKVHQRHEMVIGGYRGDNGSFANLGVANYDDSERFIFVPGFRMASRQMLSRRSSGDCESLRPPAVRLTICPVREGNVGRGFDRRCNGPVPMGQAGARGGD